MSKKSQHNGLFESSHFVLPQHKEAILDDVKRQQRKVRPSLDRQQLDYIASAIARSALDQTPITLTFYDELIGETSLTGVVKKMDQRLRRVRVASGDNVAWIPFKDILNIDVSDNG